MIKKVLIFFVSFLLLIPIALFYGFKLSPINWNLIDPVNNDSGIALRGYDPVSYFSHETATPGHPDKGLLINDAIYRFSSDENKLMYKTFPEKYIPQYGGYCATAISSGFTLDTDPEIWLIIDNKLYLFFDMASKNDFSKNLELNIVEKADAEWKNYKH